MCAYLVQIVQLRSDTREESPRAEVSGNPLTVGSFPWAVKGVDPSCSGLSAGFQMQQD